MGLDTSHDCFHGAYSSFNRWRGAIADAAGYLVADVKFADGWTATDLPLIEWHLNTPEKTMGIWDTEPPHPLYVLFFHSDCDGEIFPEQSVDLATELEKLLPELCKQDKAGGHTKTRGGIVNCTKRFISGLRLAASENKSVIFR